MRVLLLLIALVAGAISTSTNPALAQRGGQAAPAPPAQCRTYASSETRTITDTQGTATMKSACAYARAANEMVCKISSSDKATSQAGVMTTVFASVEDFIADAPRIVHVGRHATVTVKMSVPAVSTTAMSFAFDAQKRPTRMTTRFNGELAFDHRFTAWDQHGRPTAGADAMTAYTYAYDDVARVITITHVATNAVVRQSFDANGILIGQTTASPALTETHTFVIHSTAQVCK